MQPREGIAVGAEPEFFGPGLYAKRDGDSVATDAKGAVDRAASGGGEPLRADVRRRFESSLGADLSAVRVHRGAASAEANTAVSAKAYAIGNDIHFGAGQYRPEDPSGMHLLAHEVAHTVQQSGGVPRRQHELQVSAPGDASEVEADRVADAMVKGDRASVSRGGAQLARDFDGHNGPDAGPAETKASGTRYVRENGTKVYDRVGQKQTVIETLGRGAEVTLSREADGYYKCVTPSGKTGYVSMGSVALEKPAPEKKEEKKEAPVETAPEKVDEKGPWTAPKPDSVPHESVDPRVRTAKPPSPDKVWNPRPPVGWHYFPDKKTPPRAGKLLCDQQKTKPMGTFLQVVLDGKLYAVRTEWHDATVLKNEETGEWYSKPGVYNAANLMMPDEQPTELPKQIQRKADPAAAPSKLAVSAPGDASEGEADRAADAMVRGERATVRGGAVQLARDENNVADAGPAETAHTGTGYVTADGTEVRDRVGQRSTVIETLGKDAEVKLTHDASSYYKCVTPSGKTGYVLRSKVDLEKKAAPKEKEADKDAEKKAPATAALKRPNGLQEIIEVFGKPGTNLGMHDLKCGKNGAVKSVYCHNKIAPLLATVFDNIVAAGKAEHLHYFDGCYNDRDKVGGQGKSVHAWGIAVDINPEGNGRVKADTPQDKVPVSESQKILAPYFEALGFVWGKAFGDSMHFQYCTGY